MKCKEIQKQLLLPDYVSGHLSDAETSILKRHLSDCDECRKLIEVMSILSGSDSNQIDDIHPGPDELALFVAIDGNMTDSRRQGITNHLSTCSDCSSGIDLLNGLNQDGKALIQHGKLITENSEEVRFSLFNLFRKPAIAYVLLLILAYPAYIGMQRFVSSPEITGNSVFELKEMRRSVSSTPSVLRSDSDPIVRLQIPFYHMTKERTYSIVVSDSSGATHTLQHISDYSQKGRVGLVLDTRPLKDGLYNLIIEEVDPKSVGDSLQRAFPFELSTDK